MKKMNLVDFLLIALFLLLVMILAPGCELIPTETPKPAPIPNTSGWTKMVSNTTKDLVGVWGTAANNVYVVSADGYILRYNGATWAQFDHITAGQGYTLTINSIWVYGIYVFIGGQEQGGPNETGMVRWHNGIAWSDKKFLPYDILKIWGIDQNNVYVTDKKGKITHFDGTTWTQMTQTVPATTQPLYSIFGLDATTIYAGGGETGNAILRYSAGPPETWTAMTINASIPPVTNPVFKTIWGYTGASNQWWCGGPNFTGISNNGTSWTLIQVPYLTINGIWGTTDGSQIFGVGSYSSTGAPPIEHNIFRFNYTAPDTYSWDFQVGNPPAKNKLLNAIWGTGTEFFAVGEDGLILHYQ
ncbi:MAG TPA: hypothetical protein VHY08_09915 [Bacillota bacterium]|nr:hypothetical protein [Bacillota bacterium]